MSSTTALSMLYQKLVQEELGMVATVDDDGDVRFRHPDLGLLYLSISDKDPEYLYLVYPGFANADELELNATQLLQAINTVNRRCKSVKLTLEPDTRIDAAPRISASIESVVGARHSAPAEALLRAILPRNLNALRYGVEELLTQAKTMHAHKP